MAAGLKAELQGIDGFISIERFESLAEPGKLLSLSFWRDEAAMAAWRARPHHRAAQVAGRAAVFADYRLRVAVAASLRAHPQLGPVNTNREDHPRRAQS